MTTFPEPGIGKRAIQLALIAIALSTPLSAEKNLWTSIGPEGGNVVSLVVDPRNPSTAYACASQIFKTIDGGAKWHAVNPAPPGCHLIVDPQNSGTIYALDTNQIFKTTNGGAGWSAISSLKTTASVQALLIAPSNPNTLFATAGGAIFKSADAGATWAQIVCCGSFSVLAVDPQNQDTVYLTNAGGLFKSTDGGASWNPAGSGLLPWVQSVAIDPRNPETLYALSRGQIFKSTDGAASWNPANFGLPPAPAIVQALAINPQTPAVLYALLVQEGASASDRPYYAYLATSTDGAASWTIATDPILASAGLLLNEITPDPQDAGTVYLGTNNGVLKTTDAGGHWNFTNSGLRALGVGSVVLDPRTAGTLFAVSQELFKSTDGGSGWFPSNVGLPSWPSGVVAIAADPQHPATLYAVLNGGASGGLFKSQDGGGSWAKIWSNTPLATIAGPLVIARQNPSVMYAAFTNNGIGKSTDGGHTWTQSQRFVTTGCCEEILSLAVDPQNSNIVYAGTGDDEDGLYGNLWKSTDGGVGWVNLVNVHPSGYADSIDYIVTDLANPGVIYVTTDSGRLVKSTDGGQTWVNSFLGIIGPLVIDPQDSATLYCLDSGYVFRSTDAGATWTAVGSALKGYPRSLTVDPQDPRTLYAGTDSGLFAITLDAGRPHRVH